MEKMFNKKGLSPLIATILLIALAVAIGTSFVSYAGSYFEAKSLNEGKCKNYFVDFFELDNKKNVCMSQFGAPFALKFGYENKKSLKTDCYISVASGTSKICNAKPLFINSTWALSEGVKI